MSETTIYDTSGRATVYLTDAAEIYTWEGHAVAYIVDGDKVYGWNGQHIGWWRDGIAYDGDGYQVGYVRGSAR